MKTDEVEIGGVYLATVSGKTVPIEVVEIEMKLDRQSGRPLPIWHCREQESGRSLTIRDVKQFWQRIE